MSDNQAKEALNSLVQNAQSAADTPAAASSPDVPNSDAPATREISTDARARIPDGTSPRAIDAFDRAFPVVQKKLLITVSRSLGSRGSEVARALGSRLGIAVYDRTLMKRMAHLLRCDESVMRALDETAFGLVENLIRTVLDRLSILEKSTGTPVINKDYFFRTMVKMILKIAESEAIIVGRGAHLILHDHTAFRIRIDSSPEAAARRLARRENIRRKRAAMLIKRTNSDRAGYLKQVRQACHIPKKGVHFDLNINADNHTVDAMVELIVEKLRTSGYVVPDNTLS